jgi:hypothetical protein
MREPLGTRTAIGSVRGHGLRTEIRKRQPDLHKRGFTHKRGLHQPYPATSGWMSATDGTLELHGLGGTSTPQPTSNPYAQSWCTRVAAPARSLKSPGPDVKEEGRHGGRTFQRIDVAGRHHP